MTYLSEVLADSPLAYYRLGETSGTALADSSGNNRNAALNLIGADVTMGVTGLLTGDANKGMEFLAPGFTVGGPETPYASWMNTDYVSIEAIIRPDVVDGNNRAIAQRDDNGSTLISRLDIESGKFRFLYNVAGGYRVVTGVMTPVAGTIYHVVATFDGAEARIYVNGALDNFAASTGVLFKPASIGYAIGHFTDGFNRAPFDGVIDEVAFYGTALSPARVAAHHAAIAGGPPPPDPPAGPATGYAQTVLGDAPLGYWRLSDAATTTMSDSSGNGRHGAYGVVPTSGQPSLISDSTKTSTTFTTENMRGVVPDGAWMDAVTTAWTIECWVEFKGIPTADKDFLGRRQNYWLGIESDGDLSYGINSSGFSNLYPLPQGEPIHLVWTYGQGWRTRIYVNGQMVNRTPNTGVANNVAEPFVIGGDPYTVVTANHAVTRMQEVALYGVELSPDQVLSHYEAGTYKIGGTVRTIRKVKADNRLTQQLYVTWSRDESAEKYEIRVNGGAATTVYRRFHTLTGLTNGTTYTVEVRGINSAGTAGPWTSTTGVPAVPYVWDDFARAASTTVIGSPVAGGPWTVRAGTWGIIEESAYTSVNAANTHVTVPAAVDVDIEVAITVTGLTGAVGPGLVFRWVDINNYWYVRYASSVYTLVRRTAGTDTTYASWGVGGEGRLGVVAFGRLIYMKWNGQIVGVAEDGFFSTAGTAAGLHVHSASNGRIDEVLIKPVTIAPDSYGTAPVLEPVPLTLALTDATTQVAPSLYKGRDTALADESEIP